MKCGRNRRLGCHSETTATTCGLKLCSGTWGKYVFSYRKSLNVDYTHHHNTILSPIFGVIETRMQMSH
jgi:hypothetical protein